jgi:glycosyltransferase involved in cell wall biosynthesis
MVRTSESRNESGKPEGGDRRCAHYAPTVRVLLLANAYPSDKNPGFGAFVRRAADALADQGVEVERAVLTTRARGRVQTPLKYAGLAALGLTRGLAKRPDVVWSHYLVPTGTIARRVGKLLRVPYVATAHGTDVVNAETSPRLRELTGAVLRDAAAVVAVSDQLADRLRALYGDLDGRLHVVSAGIDLARFHPGDGEVAATALGWDAPHPRFAFVGNLVEVKNVERLLEAFARVHGKQGGALAVVGDGPLRPALEARAAALGIADAVTFTGEVASQDVARWMRAADVGCLVSQVEGFGLVAVESLACGRPVVLTQNAGAAHVVTPGVNGALCDPQDVESIVAALEQASTLDPGEQAARAAAPYAVEKEAARVAAILDEAVRRGRR